MWYKSSTALVRLLLVFCCSSCVAWLFVKAASTSLLLSGSFLLQALFGPTIVCSEAAFCIKAFFFPVPSHLTIYCLVKGASAHFKTKTKMNLFHSEPSYQTYLKAKLKGTTQIAFQSETNRLNISDLRVTQ